MGERLYAVSILVVCLDVAHGGRLDRFLRSKTSHVQLGAEYLYHALVRTSGSPWSIGLDMTKVLTTAPV